ncbi:uncharacterized protein LOC124374024 [Homalodisca vitripennis]|uniref:uncharacterized protein LOC124374024 n=1 Tax=Homalodisca vitripennis TaxID=197043 RepID=UPI001EEC3DEE|nr:uncharacterized protein LOC124374024 [Homalodisca vitripennis]
MSAKRKRVVVSLETKLNAIRRLDNDVVYWVSEAWDNVREDTIRRSWRKLFGIEKASRQETAAPENQPRACPPENEELVNLCNHLPVAEPISAEDISEWINGDEDQALTDDVIIQMLNQPEDDDNDEPDGATEKISHTEGLRTIEGALAYIEQQETATTNDLVWLRRWRNRAASLSFLKFKNFWCEWEREAAVRKATGRVVCAAFESPHWDQNGLGAWGGRYKISQGSISPCGSKPPAAELNAPKPTLYQSANTPHKNPKGKTPHTTDNTDTQMPYKCHATMLHTRCTFTFN